MSLVRRGNVVKLMLFVFTKFSNWKTRRTLFETFTVTYALEEWEWIETEQPELRRWIWRGWRFEGDILCNIKKQELYLDIDYEELQNFNFVQSDEEENNAKFSVLNPKVLDLDLEESDNVSKAGVVSTIIGTLLLLNEQFYEMFSIGWRSTAFVQFYNRLCIALQISRK